MELKEYTVEELVNKNMIEKPFDGNHGNKHPKSSDYVEIGIPFIMVSDINNGRINYNTCKFITEEQRNGLDKGFSRKGDILLSHKATIGVTCIVDDLYPEIVITPQLTCYRVKNGINKYYLKYYFDSPYFQNILKNWATSGSTRAYLGITAQLKLPILLPELEIQNKISKILSLIDRKIELNMHTNNNLLQLGDLIYNNFFNDSKKEWSVKTLKEISNNFDSKRKPMSSREREEHKGTYPYYGATSIIDYVDNYLFDDTYILMGEDGTVITDDNKPVLQYIWGKFWANNHAHVLQGSIVSNEYLYFALRNTDVKSLVTGAVQPKINQENMNKLKFIIPDQDNLKILENSLSILMKKYKENCCKISTLEQIRYTLLPKLMNGEIDLDKVEI